MDIRVSILNIQLSLNLNLVVIFHTRQVLGMNLKVEVSFEYQVWSRPGPQLIVISSVSTLVPQHGHELVCGGTLHPHTPDSKGRREACLDKVGNI